MVARFDIFLHHRYATAVAPMIVSRRGAATTGPAELVVAEATGHVVASHVLLYAALAARAKADSVSIFLEPRAELLRHRFFTANIFSVPWFLALEANLSAALRTCQLLCIFIWSAHVRLAARFGAPAHQRVSFERLLVLEALVFGEQGAVWSKNVAQNSNINGLLALVIKAFNLVELSTLDAFFE